MASKSGPRIVNDSISLYVDVANSKSYNDIEQKRLTTPAVWQSASAAIASKAITIPATVPVKPSIGAIVITAFSQIIFFSKNFFFFPSL